MIVGLVYIEEDIHLRYLNNSLGVFFELDRDDIASLEVRKDKIIRLDEESWRPKIPVIYRSEGDNIMILFINMLIKEEPRIQFGI